MRAVRYLNLRTVCVAFLGGASVDGGVPAGGGATVLATAVARD